VERSNSSSHTIAAVHSKWLCPTLKILFVKTSSLGDVVHNCPAVTDAARKLPAAEIDWVVEEPFAAIAAMHPAVRGVIPVRLRRKEEGLVKERGKDKGHSGAPFPLPDAWGTTRIITPVPGQ